MSAAIQYESSVVPKLCPTPVHSGTFQPTRAREAVVVLSFGIK
jgi:hypothetical protein